MEGGERGKQSVWLPHCRVGEGSCLPSWLLGKSGPEWSRDGCQQLGDLYRAEKGVSDMPGCGKEHWSCQASRPLPRLSGRGSWSGKGTGGTESSGDSGAGFRSTRSADEDKAGPWPQRNWALMQHIRVDGQPALGTGLEWLKATYLCSRKDWDCSKV